MICLLCIEFSHTKENCECDILQIYDPEDLTKSHNFTKEIDDITKSTMYSTKQHHYFWWSNEEGSWIWNFFTLSNYTSKNSGCLGSHPGSVWYLNWQVQNGFAIKPVGEWKVLPNGQSNLVESRCLALKSNDNKCDIKNQTYRLGFLNSKRVAPCELPFKYKKNEYKTCTTKDKDSMWCATWVDDERNMINWAYCNAICPVEIPSSTIAAKVTIPIVIIIVIAIVVYWYKKRQKQTTMNANMNKYSNAPVNEQATDMAYNGKYEIDRNKFEIGRKLGGGSFGSVYEGTTEDLIHPGQEIKIAIKSVNNPLDPSQIYAMMCEIKVLDKLEMNLNLVNMIGACTTEFKSGRIWLLLEHCTHGDMKNFLLKNSDVICQGLHYQSISHQTLNIRLFLKWSHGICKGMKYLASKNIMHGDLAARNILITNFNNDERYLAKICDFGLSKAFYDKTSYHKQERKNIPWKWMARGEYNVENLKLSRRSHKSCKTQPEGKKLSFIFQ